ncbi:ABC transporter permease subunit [soil metagenome]|jgi:NitT/TauT family transport system permease protein
MASVQATPTAEVPPPQAPPSPITPRRNTGPRKLLTGLGWIAIRLYPVVVIIGLWQALVSLGLVSPFTMPAPARVWDVAVAQLRDGTLQRTTWTTLSRIIVAWSLAVVVGVVVGILIGRVQTFRRMFRPIVAFFFPTPKVAIYPALVILFGLGAASKIALGFAEAVFPILLATSAAASQIDSRLLWTADNFETPRLRKMSTVVLPAALPGVMTGARIGLVGAIIGVFMGELIVGSDGLGHTMAAAYRRLQTGDMYVAVAVVSLIGFTLDRLFLAARRRLLRWSPEVDH